MPKISVGNPLPLHYFQVPKTFGEDVGGVSRFYGEKLLSDSAENIRMGILYCCINFGYRKSLERRGVSRLYVEIFLPHSAEKLRRGIFYCCVNFEYRKKLEKWGGIKFLRRKIFDSQCRNFP